MRGSERLTALALLALSATAALAASWGAPGAGARLGAAAGLFGLVLLLARTGAAAGPLGWLRDLAPVAVVVAVYLMLQPLIEAANPRRYDPWLAGADERWLAGLVAAWFGLGGRPPWLVDVSYAAYWSFYLLPISAAVAARLRRGVDGLERVSFPVLLCFSLSFLGYFLWPALGPRVPAHLEDALLGGGAVARAVRGFLHAAEATTLAAFPSGHTGISVVSAAVGARLFPRAAPWWAAWASLVVFSTVYVRVHYAVDVAAGALLAGAVLLASPGAARWLGGRADR